MKIVGMASVLLISMFAAGARAQQHAVFSFVENEQGITLLEGIRPVLTYQRATRASDGQWPRANYVHPLYDLDGELLTEDFPADHGHHRGVFWAWHQVYIDDKPLGDAWVCNDFQWDVIHARAGLEQGRAIVQATTFWKSSQHTSDQGTWIPFVLEQSRISVQPQRDGMRFIDFDIRLTALVPGVRIGGSDDEKGYGGFSPRIKLTGDEVFLSTEGEVNPTTRPLHAGPWIDISTPQRGVTILTHPSNPGSPQPWILRRQRSMQNAVFPGRQPVPLPTDAQLRLRYRLVLHRGQLESSSIDQLQTQYQAKP